MDVTVLRRLSAVLQDFRSDVQRAAGNGGATVVLRWCYRGGAPECRALSRNSLIRVRSMSRQGRLCGCVVVASAALATSRGVCGTAPGISAAPSSHAAPPWRPISKSSCQDENPTSVRSALPSSAHTKCFRLKLTKSGSVISDMNAFTCIG